MSEQDDGRLFPEPKEASSEIGTTYDHPEKVELPKPTDKTDFTDAEIKLPSE